jgi:hypothetical protein
VQCGDLNPDPELRRVADVKLIEGQVEVCLDGPGNLYFHFNKYLKGESIVTDLLKVLL